MCVLMWHFVGMYVCTKEAEEKKEGRKDVEVSLPAYDGLAYDRLDRLVSVRTVIPNARNKRAREWVGVL